MPDHPRRAGIRPHTPLRGTVHTVMTGAYVLAKLAVTPLVYVARRAGLPPSLPARLDAAVYRRILPLTERPDRELRCEVAPRIEAGDVIPDVEVRGPEGRVCSLRSFTGQPLLLVLVRGSWCSYSRLHLADLSRAAAGLAAEGVRVVAVTSGTDGSWWTAHGITIPVVSDPGGDVFASMGLRLESWLDETWGRVLPHESALLFDASGRLVAADTRSVSGLRLRQTFLGADRWIEIARSQAPSPPARR